MCAPNAIAQRAARLVAMPSPKLSQSRAPRKYTTPAAGMNPSRYRHLGSWHQRQMSGACQNSNSRLTVMVLCDQKEFLCSRHCYGPFPGRPPVSKPDVRRAALLHCEFKPRRCHWWTWTTDMTRVQEWRTPTTQLPRVFQYIAIDVAITNSTPHR
jgi:hypothetical protein